MTHPDYQQRNGCKKHVKVSEDVSTFRDPNIHTGALGDSFRTHRGSFKTHPHCSKVLLLRNFNQATMIWMCVKEHAFLL